MNLQRKIIFIWLNHHSIKLPKDLKIIILSDDIDEINLEMQCNKLNIPPLSKQNAVRLIRKYDQRSNN